MNFKITNEQFIQMAAVDAGLDPFAEYCTRGMWAAAGYKVKPGEKPCLVVDLWCPRQSKEQDASVTGDLLPASDSSASPEKSQSIGFFMFKTCHLFSRSQVVDAETLEAEKASRKFAQERQKALKKAIMPAGIAPSQDYESIPQWCKRKAGVGIDVAVDRVREAGFPVQDADGLYQMLLAM